MIAHSFDNLGALTDTVAQEWAAFGVRYLRLRTRPGTFSGRDVVIDQTIHAARAGDMARPDGRVELLPFWQSGDAITLIADRYRDLERHDRGLADDIPRSDPDDLRSWRNGGYLHRIAVGDETVGALAIAPGAYDWMTGDEVQEEVIAAAYVGNCYAASAQAQWAASVNSRTLLIGTIVRRNVASRRTAERAGRPAVLEDVFLTL